MTYATPPETFEQMTAPFPQQVQETAQALRQTIRDAQPQVEEKIYGGSKIANALYHYADPNQVLFGIQPGDKVCKLFVHFFDEVKGMGFRIEGSGKHARHIKFSSPEEVDIDALKPVLEKVWLSSNFGARE